MMMEMEVVRGMSVVVFSSCLSELIQHGLDYIGARKGGSWNFFSKSEHYCDIRMVVLVR
jgi:hypothetical protein